MSEENVMDFPADEHSKILRKRWEEIRTESDNAEKKERKVRGGQNAEYLAWHQVVSLLNSVAPDWEMSVDRIESIYGESRSKGLAEATVTLRILGVARQDIGISEFGGSNNQSEDNARKGAVRLALVRAANLFGVGCDIKENNQNNQNNQNNRNGNFNRNNGSGRNNNFSGGGNAGANRNGSTNFNKPANTQPNTANQLSVSNQPNTANQPISFEAPKLRSDIRSLLRELNIKEDAPQVAKIISEELGVPNIDKCSDVPKLTNLKNRIEKRKNGDTNPVSSSVPPLEASKTA